jgi:large subunit ribosomal protein L25
MATNIPQAIVATPREGTFNKGFARRVRMSGLIPAVVYGAGLPPVAVTVDPRAVTKILHSESGHNTIFDLDITGQTGGKAMIRVSVPVQLIGTPVGVKTQGGILDQVLREVEIECLPNDIPSHLDVDVSELALNGVIHLSDLPHSGSIKYLGDEKAVVAHVTAIKEEEAAAVATTAEPEVAKKGKTDAAAAAPAADAKKK